MKKLRSSPPLTLGLLLCAALGLGALSLVFAAAIDNRTAMFFSYFRLPLLAFLNLAPVVVLVFALYCLTARAWISFLLSSCLVLGFSLANWFKLQFRDDPLLFEDLLLLKEAGNMAGKYQLFLTKTMVLAALLVVAGTLFLLFFARARLALWPRIGGVAVLLLLLLPLKSLCANNQIYDSDTANNALINRWSATELYQSKGFVYPFIHSMFSAAEQPPKGYDSKRARDILSAYEDRDIPEDKKVSVISLMLESYADFTKFGTPELDPKVYEVFHKLEAESYCGNLITNIFAGGTVDTERCFLTGYATLGAFRAPTNSYPWYFRDQGYTVEGAHPCFQWFYNRVNCNENLGFERYDFVENHFGALTGGDVAYDKVYFPELIKIWEADKEPGKPYFAFHLSYQGHGPYDQEQTWFGDDFVIGGDYTPAERNILNNYFGSIYDTNSHLEQYFDYYRKETEPVVIVLFGDHMPWMGDANSVYHTLGIDLDISGEAGFYNYYSTRYLIWANDAAKAVLGDRFRGNGPDLSPNFLMNEVFARCGWEGPAFMQATRQLQARLPVLNRPTGLCVEDGRLTDSPSPEGRALLDDYNMVQYYRRKHFAY